MPAPRKPSNVLALNGAFKKHPERAAGRASEPTALPAIGNEPPVTLSEIEALCWHEVVARCPAGVLCDSDEHAVELAAKLLAGIRYGEAADLPKLAPLLLKTLGLLGMTPADRSRVSAAGVAPEASPYDEFDPARPRR